MASKKNINIEQLKKEASFLIDDGENIEYTRGVCELIASLDGVEGIDHSDRAAEIAAELGVLEKYMIRMW